MCVFSRFPSFPAYILNFSSRIRRSELSDWLSDEALDRFPRRADVSEEDKSLIDPEKNVTERAAPATSHSAHLLTERIVLLTFNSTDVHPINASQSEIQQLCTEVGCQPSLEFQEHSRKYEKFCFTAPRLLIRRKWVQEVLQWSNFQSKIHSNLTLHNPNVTFLSLLN